MLIRYDRVAAGESHRGKYKDKKLSENAFSALMWALHFGCETPPNLESTSKNGRRNILNLKLHMDTVENEIRQQNPGARWWD